jgi:hypothetical protein
MKKFEILNNKWISQLDFSTNVRGYTAMFFNVIKIDDITRICCEDEMHGFFIHIGNFDGSMSLFYNKTEKEDFDRDLSFFKSLLF